MSIRFIILWLILIQLIPGIFAQNQPFELITKEETDIVPIIKLSEEEDHAFKERIQEVVTELTDKISIIGDKGYETRYRREAIKEAVKLFLNKQQEVHVSSVTKPDIKVFQVMPYFEHLFLLPYEVVKVKFSEIARVSDLERTPDGRWVGVAFIYQDFIAFDAEGRIVYKDSTIKKVEVEVVMIEKDIGPEKIQIPKISLGNIKVLKTE
ncbi:MAG: hypothetical protein AAF587_14125 [Bacteroidota bacterium]